jgi:Uma2 family endonuclease
LHDESQLAASEDLQAPFDVLVEQSPLRVRQPDIFVVSDETLKRVGGAPDLGPLTVPPELVVEILSPSESRRILGDKIRDFCAIGVQECWVISPEGETIEVLRLSSASAERVGIFGSGQQVHSSAFAGLMLNVTDIFANS